MKRGTPLDEPPSLRAFGPAEVRRSLTIGLMRNVFPEAVAARLASGDVTLPD